jgi:GDPmannose 4,6-dehydratase
MPSNKKAFITGVTGQDGSYLAELLLNKGYEVHGLIRRSSSLNTSRIQSILSNPEAKFTLHYGDLADSDQIIPVMCIVKPDEVYNLAAQSHVGTSFEMPEYTSNITALGTVRLLESIRKNNPSAHFLQASSSEMFGNAEPPQNENTPFNPQSPYACSKVFSYWMVRNFRDGYNTYACNSMAFNHESPRRGEQFVTRKITMGIAAILAKKIQYISLGNLDAKRDWGFAPEFVEAMWTMLHQPKSDDYVIGTGETHTVQEFVDLAFGYVGLDPEKCIKTDAKLMRPTDVRVLKADTTKAQKVFKWKPKIKFNEIAKIMVDADLRKLGIDPIAEGDHILMKKFPHRYWMED